MLASLPQPKHKYVISSEQNEVASENQARTSSKRIPAYPNRSQGFIPLDKEDYGDGGSYPEIHVVQYPLNMGRLLQVKL